MSLSKRSSLRSSRKTSAWTSSHSRTTIWGESDGIVDLDYGRAYADAISGSDFTVLARTGHLPQVESPEQLLAAITGA